MASSSDIHRVIRGRCIRSSLRSSIEPATSVLTQSINRRLHSWPYDRIRDVPEVCEELIPLAFRLGLLLHTLLAQGGPTANDLIDLDNCVPGIR